MSSRFLAVGVMVLGLACGASRPETPKPDLGVVRAQLDTLWAGYTAAIIAGDADALARMYTDDGYVVESGLPTVRGNPALRSVVKEVLAGVRFLEAGIHPEQTEFLGDHVLQVGEYRDLLQPAGQPVQAVFGRFAAVIRPDGTGGWRVSRLIAVADSTVAPAKQPE